MENSFTPTNTFAGNVFDILKSDAVEDPLINVNKLAMIDLEESYFDMAVNFVNESTNDFTDCKMKLYKSLSEATNEVVILESFSDFFTAAKDVIDKFLKFIKSLFQRFINTLMGMVSSDKYIKKHKNDLNKFRDVDNFDFDGYIFTFSPIIPATNINEAGGMFTELMKSGDDNLDIQRVKNARSILNSDQKYDDFRGAVISGNQVGTAKPIEASEFSEDLFRVFRNDSLDTEEFEVTSKEVRESLNRFLDYKKTKKSVEDDNKRIEREYRDLEKDIKEFTKGGAGINMSAFVTRANLSTPTGGTNISKVNDDGLDGFTMSDQLLFQINNYAKEKVDEIQEYSNIHTLAFSAKLDALKSCFIQDKNILYRALSKVQRTDAKREEY